MNDPSRPLLYALADALEIDLTRSEKEGQFTGSRKAVLELFEGYSPTVISSIERSLENSLNGIVAADVHIFGNLGVVIVVEERQSSVHLFVYDRSKRPDFDPWEDKQWSRKRLYDWLGDSCKAIYHRSMWDKEWIKLEGGSQRLRDYNEARSDITVHANAAYLAMWAKENPDADI